MIYIWRTHKWQSKIIMHISVDVYEATVGPWKAICGVQMEFHRFAYGPDPGYPYPVCKNCLRCGVDEIRTAA